MTKTRDLRPAATSAIAPGTATRRHVVKPGKRLRWLIVWTLFGSTVINYISRQTFSLLTPLITQELHLTHSELSKILAAFQVSYAGTWLIGGVLLDLIGTRRGLTLAVIWWSIVSMLTAFAHSVVSFSLFRFLLGIGEGCNWPGASKAVAEWFPAEERGLAVAIFDSGSSVGGAIAAIAVPWVAILFGWRYAFVLAGIPGLLWLAVWLYFYHPPERHPRLTPEERELIRAGGETAKTSAQRGMGRWFVLLKQSNMWGIVLGRSLADPLWWFYVYWLPQYLSDARGFSMKQIAAFAWLPFVAADLGNFSGGFASGFLIKHGMPVLKARKWICAASCVPILAGIPAAMTDNPYLALALICFSMLGFTAWATMGLTFPSDLFPHDVVASVTGISGLATGLAAAAFIRCVGWLVDNFSYIPAFIAASTLPLLATASIFLLIRQPRQNELGRER